MAAVLLSIIYLAFISLGLPDGLLGSGWPVMQAELGVPYALAGVASMIIAGGTILASAFSSRLLRRFGTGWVTAASVALTAAALFGFSLAPSFLWLLFASIPLGLGAGAVDAGLNAFVAEHYESRHMSWLHSFWGVGALSGPLLLSVILVRGGGWRKGYLIVAAVQTMLVAVLVFAIPLWAKVRRRSGGGEDRKSQDGHQPLLFPLKLHGVKIALLAFFCYCGVEATMGLWGASYLFKIKGLTPASAATWVSLYYGSITLGRFLTGFLTYKVSNRDLIRFGGMTILAGTVLMLLPLPLPFTLAGFLLIGLGCAPIFPCMLHDTPNRFGSDHAQAIIGFQMAVAYAGTTFLPPAFGFLASAASLAWLPHFLLGMAILMAFASRSR